MLLTQNLLILDPSTLSAAPEMADALMDMHRQCFRRLTAASKKNSNNNNNNINNINKIIIWHVSAESFDLSYNTGGPFLFLRETVAPTDWWL